MNSYPPGYSTRKFLSPEKIRESISYISKQTKRKVVYLGPGKSFRIFYEYPYTFSAWINKENSNGENITFWADSVAGSGPHWHYFVDENSHIARLNSDIVTELNPSGVTAIKKKKLIV